MTDSNRIVSRRDFLKAAAGAAPMIGSLGNPATVVNLSPVFHLKKYYGLRVNNPWTEKTLEE